MTTQDDDATREAPPGWVLRTPTRRREVWALPALLLVLAGVVVVVGVSFGDPLALGAGIATAVIAVAGAVALFVAGQHAFVQQTWGASWDLHRTMVVVGVTTGAAVMVASLVVGLPFGTSIGIIAGFSQFGRFARSVPRYDLSAVASAFLVVTVSCVVLVALGLVVPEQAVLPHWRDAVWIGGGTAFALFAAVLALVHVRRATRAPLE